MAAFILGRFEVSDYETWKEGFDSDPAGRKQSGKGHRILRSADNPSEVFVQVEFSSAEEAKSFRDKLLSSGALDNVTVKTEPTVAEEEEAVSY